MNEVVRLNPEVETIPIFQYFRFQVFHLWIKINYGHVLPNELGPSLFRGPLDFFSFETKHSIYPYKKLDTEFQQIDQKNYSSYPGFKLKLFNLRRGLDTG